MESISVSTPPDHGLAFVECYNRLVAAGRCVRCNENDLQVLDKAELSRNDRLIEGPIAISSDEFLGVVIPVPAEDKVLMIFRSMFGSKKLVFFSNSGEPEKLFTLKPDKIIPYLINKRLLVDAKIRRIRSFDDLPTDDYVE
jgi:hypothetical protein